MPTTTTRRGHRPKIVCLPTPDAAAVLAATLGLTVSITSYNGACVVWVLRDGATRRELCQWVEVPTGNWRVRNTFGCAADWRVALRDMAAALGRDVIRVTGVAG